MPPELIHVADPSPPYCSACHQAKPDMLHVDFSASYDGPMVMAGPKDLGDGLWSMPDRTTPHNGVVGVVGTPIDDLVICFECVKRAAQLCGMTFQPELLDRIAKLERALDTMHSHAERVRGNVTDALKTAREKVEEPHGLVGGVNSLLPGTSAAAPAPAVARKRRPARV